MKYKFLPISDLHGMKPEETFVDYEQAHGDVLICCGDITNRGSIGEAVDWAKDWACVAKNFKRTLMIPGNHDECFDTTPERFEALVSMMQTAMPNLEVFLGGRTHVGNLKIGFNPWVLIYGSYPFMTAEEGIRRKLERMGRVDILVTHGPSYYVLDQPRIGVHAGSHAQLRYVETHQPLVHTFGHIHESAGIAKYGNTLCINAGMENYPHPGSWERFSFTVDSETKEVVYGPDSIIVCQAH